MSYKVLYVPDDSRFPVEVREAETWEDLAWMVGGAIGRIHAGDWRPNTWQAYANDDAVNAGLKYNSRAGFLAWNLGYDRDRLIHGPAVFTGPEEPEGSYITDVTDAVVQQAGRLGMEIQVESGATIQRAE